MKVLLSFFLFLQLSSLSPVWADEVLTLYQNNKQSIQYIEEDDLYRYSDEEQDFPKHHLAMGPQRFRQSFRDLLAIV